MKTLILNKKEFDKIISGHKVEEYRQLSDYNIKLLCKKNKEDGKYYPDENIKVIRLANGYNSNRDYVDIEISMIRIEQFNNFIPEDFKKGDKALTLYLGNITQKHIK